MLKAANCARDVLSQLGSLSLHGGQFVRIPAGQPNLTLGNPHAAAKAQNREAGVFPSDCRDMGSKHLAWVPLILYPKIGFDFLAGCVYFYAM